MPKRERTYGYVGPKEQKTNISHSRHRGQRRGRRFWVKTCLYGILTTVILGSGLVAWASKDLPDPNKLSDRQVAESTKIYDRTGEHILYEIFADQKRTMVELNQIPKYLVNGVIATEDKTFYQHGGIRPLSVARAVVVGVLTGHKIAGTSTLTQQLVKNAILTNERSITRKIKEAILSIRLEQKYTKDQILKIYFNEIPYGSTNYGVEAASQSYFGKHVSDLTLAEAATLAGLPQKPSVYLSNPDALKTRRNFVLQRMVEEGYITKEAAEAAKAEPMTLQRKFSDMKAPHFVIYVKNQLIDIYGEATVEKGGLKVITSLDWEKQQAAEKAVSEVGDSLLKEGGANNTALVALEPKTGQILAMVGSKNFNDDSIKGQFNVVTDARRQPGSSIKPIIYAAAFEKGYTPNTILYDVITSYPNGSGAPYSPQNYDLSEHGPVTMRTALQGSLNIPAVQTLYLVGLKNGIKFAERLGYTTFSNGNFGLTLVLGGGGVNMLEHVSAYGAFANNGKLAKPVSILKVSDNHDKILFEWKPATTDNQVISPALSATISNVLSDDAARAYVFGANSNLTLPGRSVAVKTGTTNNYVDAWVVGYTPSLVAGVWAGNTDNTPMKKGFGGSKLAGNIWNYFMREALKNTAVEQFPTPPATTTTKPILNGSAGGSITALVDTATGKLATSSTPPELIQSKSFITPHSILYYVDKDNPQGPIPANPENDPMFQPWEQAIQNWIERKKQKDPTWNVSFEEPPTEYDDEESLKFIPQLTISRPQANETFTTRNLEFAINATAPRGITKAIYKIDGSYIGENTVPPFNLNFFARTIDSGEHILTVTVMDDANNRISRDVSFKLNVSALPPSAFFHNAPDKINQNNFPIMIFLSHFRLGEIKEVRVQAINQNTSEATTVAIITDTKNLFDNQILTSWKSAPGHGSWRLNILTTDNQGNTIETDSKIITVE